MSVRYKRYEIYFFIYLIIYLIINALVAISLNPKSYNTISIITIGLFAICITISKNIFPKSNQYVYRILYALLILGLIILQYNSNIDIMKLGLNIVTINIPFVISWLIAFYLFNALKTPWDWILVIFFVAIITVIEFSIAIFVK